ncbi:hypothetical protein LCGC14_1041000 [marine sediment metagenome]|uniref:Uncharacterized protein n=1 Tax=marine sediment metagenome TaxID=412755 RepID=A0A0F9MW53_9ZZZZ
MVEIIEVNGEKKIKIGTVKVRINNTVLVELNHYQGDTLQSIEEAALKQVYDGDFDTLEKITGMQTTINVIIDV